MKKIVFVTNVSHPDIEADDEPLAVALAARGTLVVSAAWDDPDFPWDRTDLVLLRSPWDYYLRHEEFLAWVARVESQARLLNPAPVVRWNSNKRYLGELAGKGIHAVPTAFVARHETASLSDLCAERSWSTVVLKPAVSADSWETIKVEPGMYDAGQAYLERHRPDREIMVQPFVKDVESASGGEQCLVFFAGRYSHAVTKNSAFKGGRHVGPEGRAVWPNPDAIDMAGDVLERTGMAELPYARVDVARDDSGRPMLLELELFEPTLFFLEHPGSADVLADILLGRS